MGSALTGQHGKYDAFKINEWEVFVMTKRAAHNLAYQHSSHVPEKPTVLSNSPDHFMALQDLKSKALFRAKFGVKMCTNIKIKSQNKKEKLDVAKKVIYKGSFYEGIMIAGEHAETHVQDAKSLIRAKLLELKLAVVYGEPEKKVMSRSGDECVVELIDQWMGKEPKHLDIPLDLLKKMRNEFESWYPLDIRVFGKDLMQNHLTFCIYNHTAIFPKKHWPRGFRCNGHLMLNSEKMSKSTKKFMTLKQDIEEFSADDTRFYLADVGDGMDDANFVVETTDAVILRLTKERTWMEEVFAAESSLRVGTPSTYADHVFANEMNFAIKMAVKNYGDYMFRKALKSRKLFMKQSFGGSKKGSNNKVTQLTIGLVYVNEEYDRWKMECLNILCDKFDSANCKFALDEEYYKHCSRVPLVKKETLNKHSSYGCLS
nr:leucine--tRNA ligase, cytoplasmic-like [Tanacetum cinerariifolium]